MRSMARDALAQATLDTNDPDQLVNKRSYGIAGGSWNLDGGGGPDGGLNSETPSP